MRVKIKLSRERFLVLLTIVVAYALLPLVMSDYLLHICIMGAIYGVLAISWDLLGGFTGQLSFGHAAFFGIGAYVSAISTLAFNISPYAGLFLGGFVAGIVGLIIGYPCLRLKGFYLALTTMSFAEVIRIILLNTQWTFLLQGRPTVMGGPLGIYFYPPFFPTQKGVVPPKEPYFYLTFLVLLAVLVICYSIANSHGIGLKLKAIREDEMLAAVSGIDVTKYKLLAFAISSFFAGIGGGLYAHYILNVGADLLSTGYSVLILLMVYIGGVGSILGPIIGSYIVWLLSEALRAFGVFQNQILLGTLFIICIIFFPEGVIGIIRKIKKGR